MLFFCSIGLQSCSVETSDNGYLDGFWYAESIDSLSGVKAEGVYDDCYSSSHNLTKPFPKASILSCRTIRSYCPLASSPLRKGSISSNSPAAG